MPTYGNDVDLLALLTRAGALKCGHFLLASGRHSDRYVEKFDLLRNPGETALACRGFADRYRNNGIDIVVGPTTGGILLAFETARQLGVMAAYAERADSGPGREIRRGTTFAPGSKVLVVDDILTTGGSIRETLDALAAHPVEVVGVAVLVDRSGGTVNVGVPISSLTELDVATFAAGECPLCSADIPLVKPGTTAIATAGT